MKIYPVTQPPKKADLDINSYARAVILEADGHVQVRPVHFKHNWINGDSVGYQPGSGIFVLGWIPALGSENVTNWIHENRHNALLEINSDYKPTEQPSTKRKIRLDEDASSISDNNNSD